MVNSGTRRRGKASASCIAPAWWIGRMPQAGRSALVSAVDSAVGLSARECGQPDQFGARIFRVVDGVFEINA